MGDTGWASAWLRWAPRASSYRGLDRESESYLSKLNRDYWNKLRALRPKNDVGILVNKTGCDGFEKWRKEFCE